MKAGKILVRHNGQTLRVAFGDGSFQWARRQAAIEQEAKLDGIYVIRTSEPKERLMVEYTVRRYKSLLQVERAFRTLKGIDLLVRPIRHRTEDRVPAHIFLCMLAYYVEWHMRRALAPILFEDEELPQQRRLRDPILPAKPSERAKRKKRTHLRDEGLPVHSFETLMAELASRGRNTYRLKSDNQTPTFSQMPKSTQLQARAYELLGLLPVAGK